MSIISECEDGRIFEAFFDTTVFNNATDICIDNGGSLAIIKESETNDRLRRLLIDGDVLNAFIGLSADFPGSSNTSDYFFTDGTSLSNDFGLTRGIRPWANDQPVEANEETFPGCVRLNQRSRWRSTGCFEERNFICQTSCVPTVNPTENPTKNPTKNPTELPTTQPSFVPSVSPTTSPTQNPTISPIITPAPTIVPTNSPLEVKNEENNSTVVVFSVISSIIFIALFIVVGVLGFSKWKKKKAREEVNKLYISTKEDMHHRAKTMLTTSV